MLCTAGPTISELLVKVLSGKHIELSWLRIQNYEIWMHINPTLRDSRVKVKLGLAFVRQF